MDSNGLADPYVKLHLLPGASKVPYGLGLLASRVHGLWKAPKVPSCSATTETGSASHKGQVSCVSPELSLSGMPLAAPGTWSHGLPGMPQILRYLVNGIHCHLVEPKSYPWRRGWEQQRPKTSFSVVLCPPHIHTPASMSH